jgi:hypothetical protein
MAAPTADAAKQQILQQQIWSEEERDLLVSVTQDEPTISWDSIALWIQVSHIFEEHGYNRSWAACRGHYYTVRAEERVSDLSIRILDSYFPYLRSPSLVWLSSFCC